jgi:hypothetical protein
MGYSLVSNLQKQQKIILAIILSIPKTNGMEKLKYLPFFLSYFGCLKDSEIREVLPTELGWFMKETSTSGIVLTIMLKESVFNLLRIAEAHLL